MAQSVNGTRARTHGHVGLVMRVTHALLNTRVEHGLERTLVYTARFALKRAACHSIH